MPSIPTLIEKLIDEKFLNMWTACPAKVLAVDRTARTVKVQLKGKLRNPDDSLVLDAPILTDVPVWQYKGGDSKVLVPVAMNDIVLLVFSKIALDQLLIDGEIVDPLIASEFRLSDAIALPGLFISTDDDQLPESSLKLVFNAMSIAEESGVLVIRDVATNNIIIPNVIQHLCPAGMIAMWHGTLANIPAGWHLCDGTSGTPDLRDKFVKGAPVGINPGTTGGASTHTHTTAGAGTLDTVGGAKTIDSANHLPPYYEVAYIMKL